MLSARTVRRATCLLIGTSAVALTAAPDGTAEPRATASRACAYAHASVWRASEAQLRASVVCLIDHARAKRGLPALAQQDQLDDAAQGHSSQMVHGDYFGHTGALGSTPASRISAAGFAWGASGEAISTGFRTPWAAVWAWLGSTEHCQILLSPVYRFVGVGVVPRGVRGWTGNSGTWTVDVALPLGWRAPSGDWGPANGCPY